MRRLVRRERRRQVDADEGALGRLPERHLGRRDPLGRQAAQRRRDSRHRARRHRDHPPGADAGARAVGGREPVPRQRDHAAGRAHALRGHVPARRRAAGRARHRGHQRGAAGDALRRRPPAADRDRQGAQQARAAADPRRAFVLADSGRDAHPARHRARPEGARHRLRLHLAQARRGRGRVRHDHRDPRRPPRLDPADAHAVDRSHHRADGGPRDRQPVSARAASDRRGGAGGARGHLPGCQQPAPQARRCRVLLGAARRDPRRGGAGRRRAHRADAGDLRLLPGREPGRAAPGRQAAQDPRAARRDPRRASRWCPRTASATASSRS